MYRTHGMHGSREYRSWSGMKARCYNPKNDNFKNYGGRGIAVCARWRKSFENFYADLGPKPSPSHTLERKNVNGNYTPANCVWATKARQAYNRRATVLTPAAIKKIRELADLGFYQWTIAAIFEVDPSSVNYIVNRKTWKEV